MKLFWSGLLGSIEGAAGATFISGILVSLFDWRVSTAPGIAAFVGAVLLGAVLGCFIGIGIARRFGKMTARCSGP